MREATYIVQATRTRTRDLCFVLFIFFHFSRFSKLNAVFAFLFSFLSSDTQVSHIFSSAFFFCWVYSMALASWSRSGWRRRGEWVQPIFDLDEKFVSHSKCARVTGSRQWQSRFPPADVEHDWKKQLDEIIIKKVRLCKWWSDARVHCVKRVQSTAI